jgi:hypothetical protein
MRRYNQENLNKAAWSWGVIVSVDSEGRDVFVIDAQCGGKRFVVCADEKLTAFLELERVTLESLRFQNDE